MMRWAPEIHYFNNNWKTRAQRFSSSKALRNAENTADQIAQVFWFQSMSKGVHLTCFFAVTEQSRSDIAPILKVVSISLNDQNWLFRHPSVVKVTLCSNFSTKPMLKLIGSVLNS